MKTAEAFKIGFRHGFLNKIAMPENLAPDIRKILSKYGRSTPSVIMGEPSEITNIAYSRLKRKLTHKSLVPAFDEFKRRIGDIGLL